MFLVSCAFYPQKAVAKRLFTEMTAEGNRLRKLHGNVFDVAMEVRLCDPLPAFYAQRSLAAFISSVYPLFPVQLHTLCIFTYLSPQ